MRKMVLAIAICIFCFLATPHQAKRIPNWYLKIADKQGPNTCAVEEIPERNFKHWTECKYWMSREICGYKTLIRYECCEGYFQISGTTGCRGVRPISNLLDTLRRLGATRFVEYLEVHHNELKQRLAQTGGAPITIFAPTNQAFQELGPMSAASFTAALQDPRSSPLLYHIILDKKIVLKDLETRDSLIDTMLDGQNLRIGRYSNGMTTVNCIPVIRKDQTATNGLVHLIEGVLVPSGHDSLSIPEALIADQRFRELARAMLRSELVNRLRHGGPYTLLAPFDEAFHKRNPETVHEILGDQDARLSLLQNHVIPNIICPSAIINKHQVSTLDGQKIDLSCNQSGTYVNNAKVTREVISTRNGIIGVIDDVLIPDKVRSLLEALESQPKLKRLHALLQSSQLKSILVEPLTLFAPSDEAFQRLDQEKWQLMTNDDEALLSFLMHHCAWGRTTTSQMTDEQRLQTLDGQGALRIKVYRKAFGVESAILKETDIEFKNGIIHVIDRVLNLPSGTSLDVIRKNDNFSIFQTAIESIRDQDPTFLLHGANNTLTVFAPSNQAFRQLDDTTFQRLMDNATLLKQVLQHHIVDGIVSASSVLADLQYRIPSEFGGSLRMHQSNSGELMVDNARVTKSDIVTSDGIVHCIDRVLLPNQNPDF